MGKDRTLERVLQLYGWDHTELRRLRKLLKAIAYRDELEALAVVCDKDAVGRRQFYVVEGGGELWRNNESIDRLEVVTDE